MYVYIQQTLYFLGNFTPIFMAYIKLLHNIILITRTILKARKCSRMRVEAFNKSLRLNTEENLKCQRLRKYNLSALSCQY